jgi:vancomycin aglycone glucosyltransferase
VVGLAVALRDLGAQVQVSAPPDDDFVALLARVGVPLVPLGPTVKSVVSTDKPPAREDALRLAPELVAARFESLTAAAAGGCDAILATGLMPAGARDVAEKLGIRYVFARFHILGMPTPQQQEEIVQNAWGEKAEQVDVFYNGLYKEALNSHRAAIGLPPVDSVRQHVYSDQQWLAADETLCPVEPRTDLVQTGAWILPDNRPLPDGLDEFLDAGEPPVYVGLGSMASYAPKDIAQVGIEAIRAQGRRVVLGSGWAGLVAIDDADDCFVVGEVNHQALFRRVAAVVHHGGAGTTTTAAVAGAPQVIVPQIADQPFWGSRVAELGIGAAHEGRIPTFESLSATLSIALTPETAVRAKAVAGKVRTDGATVAAKLLLEA